MPRNTALQRTSVHLNGLCVLADVESGPVPGRSGALRDVKRASGVCTGNSRKPRPLDGTIRPISHRPALQWRVLSTCVGELKFSALLNLSARPWNSPTDSTLELRRISTQPVDRDAPILRLGWL